MVMLPVLYTDTTDAWKLRDRSARLRIVSAGVRVELFLALIATFVWGIMPDGIVSSIAFFVATTSWVTSVLINISPFLRFDGYYAFSDLIGVENLQQRACGFRESSLIVPCAVRMVPRFSSSKVTPRADQPNKPATAKRKRSCLFVVKF